MVAVDVCDLVTVYPDRSGGQVRAVDGVSMRVGEGEVFAFLGPNGAGKTTAVRIVTTLTAPSSGMARIAG